MTEDLEDIEPRNAVNLYLQAVEREKSDATIRSHRSRLSHFVRWCTGPGEIVNMNNVSGRDLHEYRIWRRNEGINKVTEKTQMDTLRVFIRWCESIDSVPNNLSEKVLSPSLSKGDNVSHDTLDAEVSQSILEWLSDYRYASSEHVTLTLMWRGLLRRGAVRAIDEDDYDPDERSLQVRHRPSTDTPLKNQEDGERWIALRPDTTNLIDDYLTHPDRPDVTDEYGRSPLITTRHGRPHRLTIASWVYGVTRPCVTTGECPHSRDIDSCEAASSRKTASKCPSSVSPHPVRRGGITNWLSHDVPENVISDRANTDVIDEHYDERTERDKMEQRRRFLDRF